MPTVYLALGSNLGNRAQYLSDARTRLVPPVRLLQPSSIYETEPWGDTAQPRFLNQVVRGETELPMRALLAFLKNIEREMGRAKTVRYGPRVIDLDILFYDKETFHDKTLTIPHPRLHERRFVLVPLAEIAPDIVHPNLQLSVRQLLARLPEDDSVHQYGRDVQ